MGLEILVAHTSPHLHHTMFLLNRTGFGFLTVVGKGNDPFSRWCTLSMFALV